MSETVTELRGYELVYVLQPEIDEQSILDLNERLSAVVSGQDGQMITSEMWGKRTLAYPIKKLFEGQYVLHRFQMPPNNTGEIDRLLRYNENVLRYLLVRHDDEE